MAFSARLLSYLLHPLLMPMLALWVLLELDPHIGFFIPSRNRWLLLGTLAVMTVVFPITSVLLMRRAGLITSLELPRREERIAPYLMTLLYVGMALYLLYRTPIHPIAFALFVGILIAIVLSTVITIRWKISAHMVGIGGLVGALFAVQFAHGVDVFIPVVLGILIAGALGTARLLCSDHSPAQIYSGALLGGACTLLCMLFLYR